MRNFFKKLLGGKAGAVGGQDNIGLPATLDDDPRWRRIHGRKWHCPCCGNDYYGIPDLAHIKPYYWMGEITDSPNSTALTSEHFLSEDFCVTDGEHYFVRCLLRIPIIGSDGAEFGYGVWSSLSEQNYKTYLGRFNDGGYEDDDPWFGWFASSLKGYPETLSLKCQVYPQPNRQRPLIELEDTDHPLAQEYRHGMTFDRLLELHALNGHDLRAALTD